MKNIYNKVRLSPLFLLLIFLSFISGLFRDIISLFLIIIIHEMGHVIMSLIFKWNIDKINITMYGGYITYNENIDKPFIEEFLISISGILMQSIFFFLLYLLNKVCIVDIDTLLIIRKYHYSVLLFNLIPVVPLDGAKVLNVILNNYFSYKKSLDITNYISVLFVILLLGSFIILKYKVEFSYLVILSFIISSIIKNIMDSPFLFNKFLFERYKKPVYYVPYYIKSGRIKEMRRQRKNYFYIDNRCVDETIILNRKFMKNID